MGKPFIIWKNWFYRLDSQTQCFMFDVQLLWSYDYSKWAIFTKNRILQWQILNFGKAEVEKLYAKLPKGTPLRQWSNKSLGVYVALAVTLFWHYTATRKKYVRIAIGN